MHPSDFSQKWYGVAGDNGLGAVQGETMLCVLLPSLISVAVQEKASFDEAISWAEAEYRARYRIRYRREPYNIPFNFTPNSCFIDPEYEQREIHRMLY